MPGSGDTALDGSHTDGRRAALAAQYNNGVPAHQERRKEREEEREVLSPAAGKLRSASTPQTLR